MALTIGVDLGDKWSQICVLDDSGEVAEEARIRTTREAFTRWFQPQEPTRVALEAGTHSPWVRDVLEGCGHEVLVANSRKLRLISRNDAKSDKVDAEWLARLARLEPKLLAPIQHRKRRSSEALAILRSRATLVRTKTQLINHARGVVKSFGARLPRCSTATFHQKVRDHLPEELRPALLSVLGLIASVNRRIERYDQQIEDLGREQYPEVSLLRQVSGVGPVTATTYVLTIGDPHRFRSSRSLGAFLGLRPRRRQSGDREPQLRISKAGDRDLRRLLVGSAHYILGPKGPDCDLRRWGLSLTSEGDKNSRKRALVAVARKLAGLLHRLWITGEEYEPLRTASERSRAGQAVPA